MLCELDGGAADRPGGAIDKDRLPRPQVSGVAEKRQRGDCSVADGDSLVIGETGGRCDDNAGVGGQNVLGVGREVRDVDSGDAITPTRNAVTAFPTSATSAAKFVPRMGHLGFRNPKYSRAMRERPDRASHIAFVTTESLLRTRIW
ncbi:hypothetical protein [Microbacterium deminutum]|uniref:hypothetical protein n=1 Tax=Microbacterium deminutum TaxID=344164 RepID=UPI0031DCFEA9